MNQEPASKKRKFDLNNAPSGKNLAPYFFNLKEPVMVDGKQKFKCLRCGVLYVCQDVKSVTNLCDHIKGIHKNWLTIINDHEEESVDVVKKITSHYNPVGIMTTYAPSDKAKTINSHLKFIIGNNQPFEVVNNQYFKPIVKSESYCAKTMKNKSDCYLALGYILEEHMAISLLITKKS